MEIINRKHDAIIDLPFVEKVFMGLQDANSFYFSTDACKMIGIKPGAYMHFINDDNMWMLYVNNEPDGFPLRPTPRGGCKIHNTALATMFLKRTGFKAPITFAVSKTLASHKNRTVYKIEVENPLERIGVSNKRIYSNTRHEQ